MVRKRARFTASEYPETQQNAESQMVSGYERSREERIKENLERMQKLGIFNLANQVKSLKPSPRSTPPMKKTLFSAPPLPNLGPSRRSSRLQSATPVCYSELKVPKKEKSLRLEHKLLRLEGSRPEVYTDEHEKLLGSTEQAWALFRDGCGKDGKRIYDQVNGKSCHQCRQKTLGHRTHCSKCEMGHGQLCGDCLYIRYGEHILEAKQNPNWICSVCRGICNCSLCRHAKGWPPTGALYKKISALGYKSVAHYLIQTRRENDDLDDMKTKVPLSAKRSLPFETETVSNMETSESNFNPPKLVDENPEEVKSLKSFNEDIREKSYDSVDSLSNIKLVSENDIEMVEKTEIAFEAPEDCQESPGPKVIGRKHKVEIGKEKGVDASAEKELINFDVTKKTEEAAFSKSEFNELFSGPNSVVTPVLDEDMQKPESSERNIHSNEPVTDGGIIGRLRLSQNGNNECEEEVNGSIVGRTKPLNGVSSFEIILYNDDPKDVTEVKEDEMKKTPISKKKPGRSFELIADSIAGRLRQRRPLDGVSSELILFNDDAKEVTEVKEDEMEKTPISKKKRGRGFEPIADSIAGRLRQRRPLNGVSSLELILFNDDAKDVTKVKEDEMAKTPISKKHGRAIEPIADSIGGRLRQQRPTAQNKLR